MDAWVSCFESRDEQYFERVGVQGGAVPLTLAIESPMASQVGQSSVSTSKDAVVPHVAVTSLLRTALVTDVVLITVLWWGGSWIVGIAGEFPLIDDFSYGRAVEHLLETGDYRPLGFVSMTLFSNVLWGALFCLPTGFSWTALRLSGIVAGWLGLLGTYVLVRDMQQPRWLALIITLSLAFFPAYYLLSYTFMTDVPFVAVIVWSAVFLGRYLRRGSDVHLAIGTVLTCAAALSRQLALAIPLAFAITVLIRPGLTARAVLRAAVPLIACVVVLFAYSYWLEVTDRTPAIYGSLSDLVVDRFTSINTPPYYLLAFLAIHAFFDPVYVGLFLLPVFICSARHFFWSERMTTLWHANRSATIKLAVLGILVVASGAFSLLWMGYVPVLPTLERGNILGKAGMGPFNLRDWGAMFLDDHLVALPDEFWILTTVLGLFGALLLIAKLSVHGADLLKRLLGTRRSLSDNEAVSVFLVICSVIYLPPLMLYGVYDRYLTLLIPLFAAAMCGLSRSFSEFLAPRERSSRVIAFVLLAAWAVVSVSGTRDYLTWNAVRWQALNELMSSESVGPEDIDGGSEFNGLYLYDPHYQADPCPWLLGRRSAWWVKRDTYQIGFAAVPGYSVIKEYSLERWLPPHVQKIVVMQKDESGTSVTSGASAACPFDK